MTWEKIPWDDSIEKNPHWNDKQAGVLVALDEIGNPQEGMRIVHIVGTNGKGSVGAMMARALRETGEVVGHFSSPHVLRYNERIRIDGMEISDDEIEVIRTYFDQKKVQPLTYFQESLVIALEHFKRKGVTIAIVEAGIGGQDDITNVLHTELQVVARISMDHMHRLGFTLAEIAHHKAGVFEPDGISISCDQDPEVETTLLAVAEERRNRLLFVAKDSYRFLGTNRDEDGKLYSQFLFVEREWALSLLGAHQAQNAALAISALGLLGISDLDLIQRALKDVHWVGRMERIHTDPEIWIDGAHNDAAVEALLQNLAYLQIKPKSLVFGMHDDKISKPLLEQLHSVAENVYETPVEDLADAAIESSVRASLEIAEGPILVTGSLYILGAAIRWAKEQGERESE